MNRRVISSAILSVALFSSILGTIKAQQLENVETMSISTPPNPLMITGTGSGSPNNIPKYTSATVLGASSINDDGTTVTFTEPLTITQGSLAATLPFINHTATWSTTGTYDNFVSNVTDSGPANNASTLINLKVGGVSQFSVTKNGLINAGSMIVTGGITEGSANNFVWLTRTITSAPANGQFKISNNAGTSAVYFQTGGSTLRPAVASGFGTSPAVNGSASDQSGSINIGTGGTATTGTINFTQTWPAQPFCIAQDPANKTIATASTTVLTLTAATAWTASAVVVWHCFASN